VKRGLISAFFLLWLNGCGDPLLEPQRIERPRLLGARLEVEGEPERAWPDAGERVTLRWLLSAPNGPISSSYGFVACALSDARDNDPLACAGAPFDAVLQAEPVTAQPSFGFTLPDDPGLERIGVLGSVCAFGASALGANGELECTGEGSRLLPASFDVHLSGDEANHNPSLAAALPALDGVSWPAPIAEAAPGTACDGAAPRLSAAQRRARVELEIDATQRESIPVMEVGPSRESLQLSLAATAGRLEQPYVVVQPDDARERVPVALDWEVPRSVPAAGSMVRFYFVLRDLRGGVDWLERDACVVP
jgi:hypothetical protein